VTLDPFFLAKYEMTQAQWLRYTGHNPSSYRPGQQTDVLAAEERPARVTVTWLNPVEQLSWTDCAEVLKRLGCQLPTEAQWEYACRAGTDTAFPCGDSVQDLAGFANVADESARPNWPAEWAYERELHDGFAVHAPVGSFPPNAFGLHDMTGNVFEWCQDTYASYGEHARRKGDGLLQVSGAAPDWKACRGGSFYFPALAARSAHRERLRMNFISHDIGVRPAARVLRSGD
jgi:formylglycine-generating enzyme required for sulfatase activity